MAATSAFADVSGHVLGDDKKPIANCFVGALDSTWAMKAYATTTTDGAFQIDSSGTDGYIVVQPPANERPSGIGAYAHAPRVYRWNGETDLSIVLPATACIVLKAYDANGTLSRWRDFESRGMFGAQFAYAVNLDDEMVPASCWPVYDAAAREKNSPREMGLPAFAIAPNLPAAVSILFWETAGAGKLMLRADNDGKGYSLPKSGDAIELELNVELASSAIAGFERRPLDQFSGTKWLVAALRQEMMRAKRMSTPEARAKRADTLLVQALTLRNSFEVEAARARIDSGDLDRGNFRFGAFEGSPYNPIAWNAAKKAGFDFATVMLGWDWTQRPDGTSDWPGLDRVFGISALKQSGFTIKAHGVVYLQDYGILPERAKTMSPDELITAITAHESDMIDAYGDAIDVWEVMNEPGHTNVVSMPKAKVFDLLRASAQTIKKHGKTSLVNSAHESDYAAKFLTYNLDGTPVGDFRQTYSAFLADAMQQGVLTEIDIIGLQFYPGFHFNATFGGQEGPAVPPYWIVETAERYAKRFGKPIHITEFSVPSKQESTWKNGYWMAPWSESSSAEYVEQVYTLAYGCSAIESVTYWDVTDEKPSVVTGGLASSGGTPKESLKRISKFIAGVKSNSTSTNP